ncbi:hypothetical protein BpHYR1_002260 [Brachionus plicatilis]|uniref:Uncharacterized protein n=1 Tax=Brachionus plicatilis TaxID=10195 RepID=A0A3M7SLY7_BRAPC|nr:hypothetical protein BpHYR1_002260 [Brachionus plicatilis]
MYKFLDAEYEFELNFLKFVSLLPKIFVKQSYVLHLTRLCDRVSYLGLIKPELPFKLKKILLAIFLVNFLFYGNLISFVKLWLNPFIKPSLNIPILKHQFTLIILDTEEGDTHRSKG